MQQVTPKNIQDATPNERRVYAATFLNLDIPIDASDDQVFNAIRTANPNSDFIFVDVDPVIEQQAQAQAETTAASPVEAPAGGQGQVGTLGRGDPKWTLMIPTSDTDDATGAAPVEVGVNGRAWQLTRGVPITIPHRVKEALDHAITNVVRHNPDTGDETHRDAQRFPYQVIDSPSKAEIADWHERTDAQFCA